MPNQNQYFPQSRPHPGETLAEKLEEMAMSPKEFALRIGKPEKTITAILKGDSSITLDMATLFEHATKIPAHFWMNCQRNYDEYAARAKRQAIIEQSVAWAKKFPLAEMIKRGWLPQAKTMQDKTIAMLGFFGFSSYSAWEDYYFNQQLKVAFRISLASTAEPYAVSAWLRQGELQAAALRSKAYSEKNFKEALPEVKKIMAKHPANFYSQLQGICLEVGVKVVHTPSLPKAPICGSTRWLNDTPLIQLTGRYKRNDSFWFTFFHEAGHILLHGKKDIFLEEFEYPAKDKAKEAEADGFAVKWTLSAEEEAKILEKDPLNEDDIRKFAKQFNTHPAMIIGRLQRRRLISYSFGKKYLAPVVF